MWGRFAAAFLCHADSVRGGSFIVTGSSTNIRDLVPQIFVSHESWEPLNFTRAFTSQTKAINKSETHNIPKGGWEKKSTLEVKIKRSSGDRWCSTKGQPLAHSAVHYLLTIFLTLALLQESSVMQIIKCSFIVQGLLQVQQKVCKVIPACCMALLRMHTPASAWTACEVKSKWKSFTAHLPGLTLTETFSPFLTQNETSQGHVCYSLCRL